MTDKKKQDAVKAALLVSGVMNKASRTHQSLVKAYPALPETPDVRGAYEEAYQSLRHAHMKLRELWVKVDEVDNQFLEMLKGNTLVERGVIPNASEALGDRLPEDEDDLRKLGHELSNAMAQVDFKLQKLRNKEAQDDRTIKQILLNNPEKWAEIRKRWQAEKRVRADLDVKEKVELEKQADDLKEMAKDVNKAIDKEELRASHKIKWTEQAREPAIVKAEDEKHVVKIKREEDGRYYVRMFKRFGGGSYGRQVKQLATYGALHEARGAAEEMLCRAWGCYDE